MASQSCSAVAGHDRCYAIAELQPKPDVSEVDPTRRRNKRTRANGAWGLARQRGPSDPSNECYAT